jgi:hypothetical protein
MFDEILHVMHERVLRLERLAVTQLAGSEQWDEGGEESETPVWEWREEALKNDEDQMKKWKKYFRISKTKEQKSMSERLEEMQIVQTAGIINYDKVIPRLKENISAWLKNNKSNRVGQDDDSYVMCTELFSGEKLKGFFPFLFLLDIDPHVHEEETESVLSHLKKDIKMRETFENRTFLTRCGGLANIHAHTIPALFIQHHLVSLENPNMEFHVLCHGYDFETDNSDWSWTMKWDYDEDDYVAKSTFNEMEFATFVLESEALRKIRRRKISKSLRRICIWLKTQEHVCLFCWDEYRDKDVFSHVLHICDNMEAYRSMLNHKVFKEGWEQALINTATVQSREELHWGQSPIDAHDIILKDDFLCVSFMSRCTLMLATFEAIFWDGNIQGAWKKRIGKLKMVYRQFEIDIFEFISKMIKKGCIVLFPPEFDAKFVNINAASLVVMDEKGICTSYHYAGVEKKFTTKKIKDVRPTCVVSEQFKEDALD